MLRYTVKFLDAAQREIRALQPELQRRIMAKIEQLGGNPRPAKSLQLTTKKQFYRVRVGDHRIVYEIHDNVLVVLIVRVAHRREAYRRLK